MAFGKRFLKRRGVRQALADRSGVTAVEFALVAPMLLLLLLGIIELGAVFIADATLRMTTEQIGREVRTGQIQTLNLSKTQFFDHFCSELPSVLNNGGSCSALQLDVEAFDSFNQAIYQSPVDANGHLNTNLDNYDPGTACDVVLVRAFYKWPVQTPVYLPFLVNLQPNTHLLTAAAAFRNEPFTAAVEGC